MDMPEEITELRSRCQAHQPIQHLSDRGRRSGLCSILLVLMAEVRCGTKVEPGEEIVLCGTLMVFLPLVDTGGPELLEELGVGLSKGCGGEFIDIPERLSHNIVTRHSAVEPN
ncbi:uncharacterized protein BcabD6B2_09700 [Babesia caballi]|uniref:Uncharacterized protein n=1 Tax=Babesia caballi TaxID=5871 RepID=A0AAV4LP16_BABCB|nr:hypothetical protein BcabD6B2_09700 [Babesia caballi]